ESCNIAGNRPTHQVGGGRHQLRVGGAPRNSRLIVPVDAGVGPSGSHAIHIMGPALCAATLRGNAHSELRRIDGSGNRGKVETKKRPLLLIITALSVLAHNERSSRRVLDSGWILLIDIIICQSADDHGTGDIKSQGLGWACREGRAAARNVVVTAAVSLIKLH